MWLLLAALLAVSASADCPAGSIYDSGNQACFAFKTTPADYLTAAMTCNAMGASLASVANAFDMTLVAETASNMFTTSDFWLGAYQLANQWSWDDNTTFSYSNWDSGQPGSEQCLAAHTSGGKWLSASCSQSKPFVCRWIPPPPPTTTTTGRPTTSPTTRPTYGYCTGDWMHFIPTKSCYATVAIVSGHDMDYADARSFCSERGGQLTSIHSLAENQFIRQLLVGTKDRAWIGGEYNYQTGDIIWDDGSADDYSDWAAKNPQKISGTSCIEFAWEDSENDDFGLFLNAKCTDQVNVCVCKKHELT